MDGQRFFGILMFILFTVSGVSLIAFAVYETVIYEQINQTTYSDAVAMCGQNIQLYINQTPDYLDCQTKDECELKRLKLTILQQDSFNCMNKSWEERI